VIVSGQVDPTAYGGGIASAAVTSDVNGVVEGTARVEVIDWASGPDDSPVHTVTVPFRLAPLDSATVWKAGVDVLLQSAGGWPKDRVFARLTFEAKEGPAGATTVTTVAEQEAEMQLMMVREGPPPLVTSFAAVGPSHRPLEPAPAKAKAAAPKAKPAPAKAGRTLLASKAAPAAAGKEAAPAWSGTYPLFFTELKDAAINPKPRVALSDFTQVSDDTVSFTISSAGVAPYVALDTTLPGVFSDNNFFLLPWEPRTMTFTATASPNSGKAAVVSMLDLEASVTIMSLGDTLNTASTLYREA
jgi:hypothetical protein